MVMKEHEGPFMLL